MPTLLTLPPSRFLFRLVSLDLLAVTLALGLGVVLHRDPRWIWLLLAVGFLFLAVDEVARLHESFDRSVHRSFGLPETALSDRLNDEIVLGYGVLGVMALYACREVLPLVTCGVTLFVFMQGLDTVGNHDDVFRAVGVPDEGVGILRSWLGGIEETLKIFAEATLLGDVYHLRVHRGGAPRLGKGHSSDQCGTASERHQDSTLRCFDRLRNRKFGDLPIPKFVEPAVP